VLLHRWKGGDRAAFDALVPLVHNELRPLAAACLRGDPGAQTLDPTALVHEAYLRLVGSCDPDFGGGARVPLADDVAFKAERASLVVALDDALELLDKQDPEKARGPWHSFQPDQSPNASGPSLAANAAWRRTAEAQSVNLGNNSGRIAEPGYFTATVTPLCVATPFAVKTIGTFGPVAIPAGT